MVKIVFDRHYMRADVRGLTTSHVVTAKSYRQARSIMRTRTDRSTWDPQGDGRVCDRNPMIVH